MSHTGSTNGGFYAHFASKDDLVANVVAEEPRMQAARYGTLWPGARDSRISFATIRRPSAGISAASDARPPCSTRLAATRRRHDGGGDAADVPRRLRPEARR
ncbi:hypothetical protein [Streptomyces mirabilis]|uniref:hypothetical protein n=1 Tax=Streptomyces mirabilis TaxID=68239 RepID=UPI0036468F8C